MKKSQKLVSAEKKFSFWLVAAAAMHVFVLFLALYLQLWDSGRHVKPKIVSVTLVSLPGSGGSLQLPEKQGGGIETRPSVPQVNTAPPVVNKAVKEPLPEKPQPVARKPVPVESPKKVPVETPKKIPLEPLTPKVVEKPSDINMALERLKQNVSKKTTPLPQAGASTLNKALSALQQKVTSDKQPAGLGSGGGRSSASGGSSGAGKGSGGGGNVDPYKAKIASIIQQNWVFSQQLLKNSYGMSVYVRINIIADGTIRQIVFDKRAPSEYLNNSVKRALEKSSPLPVLPKEEGLRDVWIGFMFTPEGIE
jgi:colicin import membrane protein